MLATLKKCKDSELHLGVMSHLASRCIFERQSEECLMSLFKRRRKEKDPLLTPDLQDLRRPLQCTHCLCL